MADKPAQARKRKASSALRELAVELHITEKGRSYDLSKPQFYMLHDRIATLCSTPETCKRARALA